MLEKILFGSGIDGSIMLLPLIYFVGLAIKDIKRNGVFGWKEK